MKNNNKNIYTLILSILISIFLLSRIVEAVGAQDAQVPTLSNQDMLVDLYKSAAPSVVNIEVVQKESTKVEPQSENPFVYPFPNTPFSVSPPFQQNNGGSGFIYDDDGHIVTNNHFIENADSITVNFGNGMWTDAQVVATDSRSNLAILKVVPPIEMEWQPLPLADDEALEQGHYVLSMGRDAELNETMALGVASSVGKGFGISDQVRETGYTLPEIIRFDRAINPVHAGGPLLNLAGEVVGINLAVNPIGIVNESGGLAIPVSVIKRIIPALIEEGAFPYTYLGIMGQTIDATLAREAGLASSTYGALVNEVEVESPAAEGGIEPQDIVIGINNQVVRRFEDIASYLFQNTEIGQTITIEILRDAQTLSLDIEVAERPACANQVKSDNDAGDITAGRAISIARRAAINAELITRVEKVKAQRDVLFDEPVWNVELSDLDGVTVIVTIDAATGEVIEMTSNTV